MKVVRIIPITLLLLTACGGGGGSSPSVPVNQTPVEQVPSGEVPETPADDPNSCVDTTGLTITASDDGTNDGHLPENVLDSNTDNDSRWSSEGTKSLIIDFGQIIEIKNIVILWYNSDTRASYFDVETSSDETSWDAVLLNGESTIQAKTFELYELTPSNARYLRINGTGNSDNGWNSIIEVVTNHCGDLAELLPDTSDEPNDQTPTDPPTSSHTIELNDWYLSIPTDDDGNGKSDSISEGSLVAGYSNSDYFYPSDDGGLVFKVPVDGYKTSTNTSYTRTELREMLRRGNSSHSTQGINQNNWVFSTASQAEQDAAGGVDGVLDATLAVNHVTTTGEVYQIGRVIIGQIHANDDEPIRLYYRKLPNNEKGAIYFAHEVLGGDDIYVEMIGTRSNSASNPADGIALDERFSYQIEVIGNMLNVTIARDGKSDVEESYDMSASNYQSGGQYMYFKAGVYNQNNTGLSSDYVQATFYKIENTHTGYNY
mgnify:CR=1 FL=1